MTQSVSKLKTGVSVAAMLLLAGPALAQSTTEDNAEAVADVAGGQVVVEQEDATVDVTVPEPDVNVTQGAPVVTVEQPQPEITVVVPEPTVRVQQQAPIITVEQAQPEITVRIPEPVVTVMVPQPEVDVDTGEPMVDLQQPEPVVRFVRPEPKITIEEGQPRISVEQSSDSDGGVDVAAAQQAEVDVQREDAQVNVESGEEANIVVSDSDDPEVNIVEAAEADIEVMQAQARVVLEDFNADEQGNMAEEDRVRYEESVRNLPIFNLRVEELQGRSVATETGEDVGEIDFIGRRGDTLVAIIGVGGFLGMGENEVAIPVEKLIMERTEVIVPEYTQARLESMPEFNESEVVLLDPGVRLAEELGLD